MTSTVDYIEWDTGAGLIEYPLCWPECRPKSGCREWSRFDLFAPSNLLTRVLIYQIFEEMRLMGATDFTLSSNMRWEGDRDYEASGFPVFTDRRLSLDDYNGIALFFNLDGKSHVITSDKFDNVWCNLKALHYTVRDIRRMERYGCMSDFGMGFAGYLLDYDPHAEKVGFDWREFMGVDSGIDDIDVVRERYHELGKVMHPDNGGTESGMKRLNMAFEEAKRDLAEVDV